MSRCNYILSDYLGLVHLGLPQASRMEFVQDIVRMLQIALIWMFAVSPRYAPDMCMYVCMSCIFMSISLSRYLVCAFM